MELKCLLLGELATCCYLLDIGDHSVCAIDIGNGAEKLLQTLETEHLKLKAILLTHGHYDHVSGVETVRKATGAEVYIHENDAVMLESEEANLARQLTDKTYIPVKAYHTVRDGDILELGNRKIQVMHTPGHTSGSVCYLTGEIMFSGDTVFKNSIGRTDLGGNREEMLMSLRKIAGLNRNYRIYSGHSDESTLEMEKKYNPYLRNLI